MAEAILLTASDLMPLREDLTAMSGALDAVEAAVVAHYQGEIRQHNIVDRRPGEFEGIRLSLSAGDGLYSGLRIFGNPPHTRAFMLFEGETRQIIALMDYGVLNSLRVGAIAGVAAKHLAPSGAKTVGLIGSGWQAPPQVVALLRAVPGIERIRVFSPTQANREKFAATMTAATGVPVEPVGSVADAIAGADIVDLCAPGHFDLREPLFDPEWVKPGALVISMAGSQCTAEFVANARVVATSWHHLAQETAPKPPYDQLIPQGRFAEQDLTELGAVITKGANPRRSSSDHVLYELTGGNFHDLFVATWGYDWARAKGLGNPFDLSA
jgi:ornithine cyclodeaminase/alanine dehydrogenase-like protein (mu-crystallin family)